jgi:hypothetical protein
MSMNTSIKIHNRIKQATDINNGIFIKISNQSVHTFLMHIAYNGWLIPAWYVIENLILL